MTEQPADAPRPADRRITIDGDEVTLYDTIKYDPIDAACAPRPWIWSRNANARRGAYVLPRSMRRDTREARVRATVAAYEAAGLVVEVEDTGVRLTVAETREAQRVRLERRLDGHEHRADRLGAESDAAYAASDAITDGIPFGQPVLVGHHSEKRHRRALDRAWALMGRAVETGRQSEQYARLAEGLRYRLDHPENLGVIQRRITRAEAEQRRLLRGLNGDGEKPLALVEVEEALTLDRAEVFAREEAGEKVWRREDFQKGDLVQVSGDRWALVVRVNPTTLSVQTEYMPWPLKYEYSKVRGHRRPSDETPTAEPAAAPPGEEPPADALF